MDYVYGCQQQNLAYLKQIESERKLVAKGTRVTINILPLSRSIREKIFTIIR